MQAICKKNQLINNCVHYMKQYIINKKSLKININQKFVFLEKFYN